MIFSSTPIRRPFARSGSRLWRQATSIYYRSEKWKRCGCRPRRLQRCALGLSTAVLVFFAMSGIAPAFTQIEAQHGARIYQHQCARCHGEHGEGKDNAFKDLRSSELLGLTALPCKPRPFQKLRHQDFRTVKDIYDFVSATMHADQPASLEAEQYWDAIAFILQSNGIAADRKRLNKTSSKQVTLLTDCASGVPSSGLQVKP